MRIEIPRRRQMQRIRLVHEALQKDIEFLLDLLRNETAKRHKHLLMARVAALHALVCKHPHLNYLPYPARRREVRALYNI